MINPDDETWRELSDDEYCELLASAPLTTPRNILRRRGFQPLRPQEIPDGQLTGRLYELLYALAGHRCFFHGTDGLTDAELYAFLDRWLDQPHPDYPLCLFLHTLHDCARPAEHFTFATYPYIEDEIRALWQKAHPTLALPPKVTPSDDCTRFMPQPPSPPFVPDDATGGIPMEWLTGDDEDKEEDPLGLNAVDEAIAETQNKMEPTAAEPAAPPPCEDWQRPAVELQRTGFTPIPPDELTDDTLGAHLWEFIHQLAIRNFFATRTDHLSDAALYRELWTKAIREDALMPPTRSRTAYWMHDILGSCGEDEMNLELAIYATDEARARHAQNFPGWPLPEKCPRLIHRDWRLPRPPF